MFPWAGSLLIVSIFGKFLGIIDKNIWENVAPKLVHNSNTHHRLDNDKIMFQTVSKVSLLNFMQTLEVCVGHYVSCSVLGLGWDGN